MNKEKFTAETLYKFWKDVEEIKRNGPYEIQLFFNGEWRKNDLGPSLNCFVDNWRVKPKPVELWVNVYKFDECNLYYSKEDALEKNAIRNAIRVAVHMKEVIDD